MFKWRVQSKCRSLALQARTKSTCLWVSNCEARHQFHCDLDELAGTVGFASVLTCRATAVAYIQQLSNQRARAHTSFTLSLAL